MPRYKLIIEYNGLPFAGWQKTPGHPTVQAALTEALFQFCGERVDVTGAGRTDSGVHAAGQVGHVDLTAEHDPFKVMSALNFYLREGDTQPISVLAATRADAEFHARFSAKARHYRYRILCRRAPPALEAAYVWHVNVPLSVEAMQGGAAVLLGTQDFTSFRATECQAKSPVKTLERLEIFRVGEEIHIEVSARSFLHHMVRNITGTLKMVGEEKWTAADVAAALAARARKAAGPTAPPQGLCLMKVDY